MDLNELLTKTSEHVNAGRSFGPVYEHGDRLIIPVALTAGGGGGGASEVPPTGPGAGAGFGGISWPLGVYVVTNDRVQWIPALDMTRVVLSALGLVKLVTKLVARRRSE